MNEPNMREDLIERATGAFTRGVLDQDGFESLVTQITNLDSPGDLATLADSLPAVFGSPAPAALTWQEIQLDKGNATKAGFWVTANAYRLVLNMSNIELDLREYEGESGFRLILDLDFNMSNLKLILPEGWIVEDRIDTKIASNFKDRNKSAPWGDNRVLLMGTLRMSNVKVKYR